MKLLTEIQCIGPLTARSQSTLIALIPLAVRASTMETAATAPSTAIPVPHRHCLNCGQLLHKNQEKSCCQTGRLLPIYARKCTGFGARVNRFYPHQMHS